MRYFLQNKYTKVYYSIVLQAKSRTLLKEIYTENHHIIPKSIGESNDKDNIVTLTAREHFICHWLLTKMVSSDLRPKLIYALYMMRSNKHKQQRYFTKITARVYAKLKNKRRHSAETKAKMSLAHKGESNHFFGKKHSEETLQKMRGKSQPMSDSGKLIRSLAAKGKPKSAITKERMKNKPKKECPHCGKLLDPGNFAKHQKLISI